MRLSPECGSVAEARHVEPVSTGRYIHEIVMDGYVCVGNALILAQSEKPTRHEAVCATHEWFPQQKSISGLLFSCRNLLN